jgi:hypothetical protein
LAVPLILNTQIRVLQFRAMKLGPRQLAGPENRARQIRIL